MRLVKARVQGYRSIIDTGYFDVETDKTILVGPNEAGKTAILQALQKLNPPKGTELFDPLRDYPRAKYDEDIVKGGIDPHKFTVVEGHFALDDSDAKDLPETYKNVIYVFGRYLDNKAWHRLDNAPPRLVFSDIDKDLQRLLLHFQETATTNGTTQSLIDAIQTELDSIICELVKTSIISTEKASKLKEWLKKNIKYLADDNTKETARYDRIEEQLERPAETERVLDLCAGMMPKFILFSNYFKIKPVLHLRKLADRISNNSLDDSQYDYGNICLLKFLGFTPKELADAGDTSKFNNLNDKTQYEQ